VAATEAVDQTADEVLYRYGGANGVSPEELTRLAADATRAEQQIGYYGVSAFNHPLAFAKQHRVAERTRSNWLPGSKYG
jgi:hypothetical protein